jgi:hypothetical protein
MCEWWYSDSGLNPNHSPEIWEDTWTCKYCYDDVVYCQSCYYGHQKSEEHIEKKRVYKMETQERTIAYYKQLREKKRKRDEETDGRPAKDQKTEV